MIQISSTSTLFESLFVEILKKNSHYQKYIIGNIYRLPVYVADDLNIFINEFTHLLIVFKNALYILIYFLTVYIRLIFSALNIYNYDPLRYKH